MITFFLQKNMVTVYACKLLYHPKKGSDPDPRRKKFRNIENTGNTDPSNLEPESVTLCTLPT